MNSENGSSKGKKSRNKHEEIESNNNDQIDRINTKNLRRDVTQEREDKVESVCCILYVYILYNFYFIYRF